MSKNRRDPQCIFCKIIDKQIPAEVCSEDDNYLAIRDINPQAPIHLLVIPKDHLANIVEADDSNQVGELLKAASHLSKSQKLAGGFRLVINTGADGGQTVDHLHIHLLGGRPLSWPPG